MTPKEKEKYAGLLGKILGRGGYWEVRGNGRGSKVWIPLKEEQDDQR